MTVDTYKCPYNEMGEPITLKLSRIGYLVYRMNEYIAYRYFDKAEHWKR